MAAALPKDLPPPPPAPDEPYPRPLEFLTRDYTHPDNRAIELRERQRWRLLTRGQRRRLRAHVARLHKRLRDGKWNRLVTRLGELYDAYQRAHQTYAGTAYINDQARRAAQKPIRAILRERRSIILALRELRPYFDEYQHCAGWLEYEAKNREQLQREAALDKRIRAEMRQESSWLEAIIRDAWRRTPGCHYTYKDERGRERTEVPRFSHDDITPDAHYYWLKASSKTLLGWRWELPNGVLISRLVEEDVLAQLRAATHRKVEPLWSDQNQLIFRVSRLDKADGLPMLVHWRDAMAYFPEEKRLRMPYTIGVTEGRKFQWFDFKSHPNVLVGGKTQSGKSNLVNGIIATLASQMTPDELRIVLIDQKGGLEFSHWLELPHLLWEVAKTVDHVQPYLDRLIALMRDRQSLLERVRAKDIDAYNARVDEGDRLPRVLYVIDEMNTFVGLGQATEAIHNAIMLLVSQGRACGLHLIAATQHPEVRVLPGRIKTNIDMRISGAMPTVSASMIILDNPEAARIPAVHGRMVAAVGLRTLIVQAPKIDDEDIAQVLASARRAHPNTSPELAEMRSRPQIAVWDEQRMLEASIELLQGHLGGQKLHKMLGSESPGERHLVSLAHRIIDDANANGTVVRAKDNSRWVVKKLRKAYHLIPYGQSGQTDAPDATAPAASASD